MEHGFHHATRPGDYINATVNASGLASGFLGPCPEGFCWYVERLTAWSNTANATTGLLEVYIQATQAVPSDGSRAGRQDVAVGNIVQNGVSDERSPIYVPPGHYLVASWSNLTNGDKVALSAQIRVHRLELPGVADRSPSHHHILGGSEPGFGFDPPQEFPAGGQPVNTPDTAAQV